jgi:hypothetical protein
MPSLISKVCSPVESVIVTVVTLSILEVETTGLKPDSPCMPYRPCLPCGPCGPITLPISLLVPSLYVIVITPESLIVTVEIPLPAGP